MLRESLILIGLVFVGSCSYSGHLTEKEVPGRPGMSRIGAVLVPSAITPKPLLAEMTPFAKSPNTVVPRITQSPTRALRLRPQICPRSISNVARLRRHHPHQ